ncbi:MAG TPA: LytR C-terminal domain-containing protein [Gaiella sp.]
MDHPARLDPELAVQPWQRATLVFALVAAFELVLLVVAGGALLAKPGPAQHAPAKKAHVARTAAPAPVHRAVPVQAPKPKPAPAALPRGKVRLVVLNGNGRQGAAADAAARVEARGYHVGVVANAPRHDYPQTIVMYRRGFEGEGRRLARDLGIEVVGPLDGMKPAQLHGAQAVLILGG